MAGELYNGGYGEAPRGRGGLLLALLDLAALLLSVVTAVAMAAVFFVPRVHPSHLWILPVLGLVAPAIYVLTVVLTLYWIIRWRLKRAVLMGLLVLLGAFSVSLFWRPEVRRNRVPESYPRSTIGFLSYNVRLLYDDRGRNSADTVAAIIDSLRPDIVCLQEFRSAMAARSEQFKALLEGYEAADCGLGPRALPPQLILLKKRASNRLLRSGMITQSGASVWADVLIGEDTLRVVNNHLQSTGITSLDNAYITGYEYLDDTVREEKLRSIAGRFYRNCVLRADQVDTIRTHIDEAAPRLLIVCGDFNDTPVSYTYRRMAEGLNDAFSRCGHGYSHTFRGFFNALRIDYVLSSDELETLSYEVPLEGGPSDHLPLYVRLKKRLSYN